MNNIIRVSCVLLMLALGSVWLLPTNAVFAQCTPDNPIEGEIVICTGNDTDGVATSSNSVDVYITNDATVSMTDQHAVHLEDTATVINEGTVQGYGDADGIKADDNTTVINNDTVASRYNDAVDVGDGATIINNGTIETGLDDGSTHGDKAIETDAAATIENNGVISGNGDGVYVGDSSSVINNAGAVIHSEHEEAVQGQDGVVVENYGTISTGMDTAYDGVEVEDYATVNNSGTIEGYCDGVDVNQYSQVINDGNIHGETCHGVDAGMGSVVVNSGEITTGDNGMSGVDVEYNGVVVNLESGNIEGHCRAVRATSSAVVENYGEMYGDLCDGVDINGTGEVYNYGEITSGTYSDAGVEIDQGRIENYGVIDGGSNGIKISGVNTAPTTIINDGTIIGKEGIDAADSLGSQTIINSGTIIGQGGIAMSLGAGNDTVETTAGAVIGGLIDGGDGHDLLQFRYTFEATDFYVPAEYAVMEQTVMNAPTTGCPCVLELVISGKAYLYKYSNIEELSAFLEFVQLQYSTYYDQYFGNGMTAYALAENGFRTGTIAVYETSTGEGVHVATFDAWTVSNGETFTGDNGWTVVVDDAGMEGSTQLLSMSVLDPAGTVRGNTQILLFDNGGMAWR